MKAFEHGGNVYDSAGQFSDWLDMSANINPMGLSEAVKSAIMNNIDGLVHYPDPAAKELKSAIAVRYQIACKNIITLNGAAEFFYLFFNSIRPKRVLIVVPSFSEYERAALAANCEVRYFYTHIEENFDIDFEQLMKVVADDKIDCVVLANPNNPTGNLISVDDVAKLIEMNIFVMVDESFVDFLGDDYSTRQLIQKNKNIIIVHSLTKFFAIPGLRLGFAIADEVIVERLELSKDVWNVNYLAQKAGVAALSDENYIDKTRSWLTKENIYVTERLSKLQKCFFGPTVNFVLIKFEIEEIANYIINGLKSQGILVRSCANFRGLDGSYIRMAIRQRADNERVINLVQKFFSECSRI